MIKLADIYKSYTPTKQKAHATNMKGSTVVFR